MLRRGVIIRSLNMYTHASLLHWVVPEVVRGRCLPSFESSSSLEHASVETEAPVRMARQPAVIFRTVLVYTNGQSCQRLLYVTLNNNRKGNWRKTIRRMVSVQLSVTHVKLCTAVICVLLTCT